MGSTPRMNLSLWLVLSISVLIVCGFLVVASVGVC